MLSAEASDLVIAYEWLCRRVALKVARRLPSWVDIDELVSLARYGLVLAAMDFTRGRFEGFARRRIKWIIYDAVRNGGLGGMRVLRYKGELKTAFSVCPVDASVGAAEPRVSADNEQVEHRYDVFRLIDQIADGRTKRILSAVAAGATLREAGQREGITEARACQLRGEGVAVMRAAVQARVVMPPLDPR